MRKYSKSFIMAATIFCGIGLMTSCCNDTDDSQEQSQKQEEGVEQQQQTLVSVLTAAAYTPEEFIAHLGTRALAEGIESLYPQINTFAKSYAMTKMQSHLPTLDKIFAQEVGTETDGNRRWHFESYTFSYRSHTVDGRELVMSGRVTFPNNTAGDTPHKVKTLSLHSHQALLDPEWAPSESLMFMPMRSLWNSAVIEPDFQNWGINYGLEPESAGSPVTQAQQMADCVVAALEIMRQHGVTLADDGHSTLWGSSQTAVVPIVFTKWYETEAPEWFRQAVRLQSVFSGEGPLDTSTFYEHICSHAENLAYDFPVLLSYSETFTTEQLGGYEGKDFANNWFHENHVTVNGTDYTLYEAYTKNLMMDPKEEGSQLRLDQILPPDMMTPDYHLDKNSPKVQALFKTFQTHNDLSGWHPQTDVYFAMCSKDFLIPYEQTKAVFQELTEQCKNHNLHWIEVPDQNASFATLVDDETNHYTTAFLMLLFMSNVEEPKDMANIYANMPLLDIGTKLFSQE